MPRARVLLVPGLMGFERLGNFRYFIDVEQVLARSFDAAGLDVAVTSVRTLPTSSIEHRAAHLAEHIAELPEDEVLHVVGHSTGGLDARVLLSPGISLPTGADVEGAAQRVRSLVTLSTPHHGSPLATSFTSANAHRILRVVSGVVARLLHLGPVPASRLLALSKHLLQLVRIMGVDQLTYGSLRDGVEVGMLRRDGTLVTQAHEWLHEVGTDDSLLEQLTPDAVTSVLGGLRDRPGVRQGAVVTMAPRPSIRSMLQLSRDPYAYLISAIYRVLYREASTMRDDAVPAPSTAQRQAVEHDLGRWPDASDNDGFVPTRSQVWATVLAAVHGDHLDLMGYYGGRSEQPRLDMLPSGSSFGERDFDATWGKVARFFIDGTP